MYNAKYVIFYGCAVVFSPQLIHKNMVPRGVECEGAGFVNFNTEIDAEGNEITTAHAFGRSESLDIDSRPQDSQIITNQITNPK